MIRIRFSRASLTWLQLLAIAALVSVAACPDSTTSSSDNCAQAPTADCLAGTYTLTAINGKALPAFIDDGHEEWTTASLTLRADLSLAGSISWREYADGTSEVVDSGTDTITGTYTVNGSSLTLSIADDPPATATLGDDGILTVTEADNTRLTFKR